MRGQLAHRFMFAILLLCQLPVCLAAETPDPNNTSKYLDAVHEFADNILKHGKDTYGPKHTPLFVDGLNIHTHEPVKWISPEGEKWILSNLASQQNLFRVLDGLTTITGDPKYKQAAMEAIKYAFENLRTSNGLLSWGVGTAYDLQTDRKFGSSHCLNCIYPYYELMWEVNSNATKQFIEAFWSAHILDWSNLDMNRIGEVSERFDNPWQHEYKGGPVFFRSKKWNGTPFMSAGSDLYYAAALLFKLSGEKEPLVWSKRLAYRYVETRNTNTGIGGCIYSLRETDRATAQFGDDFREHVVNSGTIFPIYPQRHDYVYPTRGLTVPQPNKTRFRGFGMQGGVYHWLRPWICQFLLGEILGDEGKEFTQWALEELTAIGKVAYRKKDNSFIPMLTDGTSLDGYVYTKDGYYGPKGTTLKAHWAGSIPFWAYAVGYRLTADEFMWEMARNIAEGNGFGDVGILAGDRPKLEMETKCSDAYALLGFLELYSKTQNVAFLKMASRIGDNMVAEKFYRGFFLPTKKYLYTRFDYLEPLVLLKLWAVARRKPSLSPQVWPSGSYFIYDYRRIKQGVDVDLIYTLTKSPEPPLTLPEAAGNGDINEVESLIARDADVNAWDFGPSYRPLHSAVINGHKQVVELLIAKGADVNAGDGGNMKPLHHAAGNGHKEITALLIAHSADVNAKDGQGRTPLDLAMEQGHREIVKLLLSKSRDVSMHMAAYIGDLQRVEKFVDDGTDVDTKDQQGQTALHYAAKAGEVAVAEFLIAHGADVNAGGKWTPLQEAAYYSKEMVALLLAKGADINAGEGYWTALHHALDAGRFDIVELLLAKGADVNIRDVEGRTPLHITAWYAARKNPKVVELLLSNGADIDAKDNNSKTALSYAIENGHTEIVELLRKHGAKEDKAEVTQDTRLPILDVERKRNGTYLTIRTESIPGLLLDVWCYEDKLGDATRYEKQGDAVVLIHKLEEATVTTRFEPRQTGVDIQVHVTGPTAEAVRKVQRLNPCCQFDRSASFRSEGNYVDDFVARCFVFLDADMTLLKDTKRIPGTRPRTDDKANYPKPWIQEYFPAWRKHPGQIKGQRGYSPDRPVYPIIGAVSRDGKYLAAIAWPETASLGQVWHHCIHPRPLIAESFDSKTGEIRSCGKIYLMENDEEKLLARFKEDFPNWRRPLDVK